MRSLAQGAEVRFSASDIPLDEVLLTLHETRFTGLGQIGSGGELDKIHLRGGRVIDVVPAAKVHVKLLAEILASHKAVPKEVLDATIAEDANMDGALFARRLVARGHLNREALAKATLEQARRRLFLLYDHPNATVVLTQGLPEGVSIFHTQTLDLLPSVAYGMVTKANPTRRQAMLAFASHKRARLYASYDEVRNRYGLPPPLLEAMRSLAGDGTVFGSIPCLPGLSPEITAGLLLLLQRTALLTLGEITRPPPVGSKKPTTWPVPRAEPVPTEG